MAITFLAGAACKLRGNAFERIAMKNVSPVIATKNVILTAVVIGALLFGTGALLFALAVGVPTSDAPGKQVFGHHGTLSPIW
jgi:hypothetical protein